MIRHCLVCDLPLEGSIEQPVCTRCDLRFDEQSLAVHARRRGATALLSVGVILLALSVPGKPVGRWDALHLMMLGTAVLLTWLAVRPTRRKAVIGSDAIVLCEGEQIQRRFACKKIAAVRTAPDESVLQLEDANGSLLDSIDLMFFGSDRRADKFVAAVCSRIAAKQVQG